MNFSGCLRADLGSLKTLLGDSDDVKLIKHTIGRTECAFLYCEGMVDKKLFYDVAFKPILDIKPPLLKNNLFGRIKKSGVMLGGSFQSDCAVAAELVTSGSAIFLADGTAGALCFAVEGYKTRAISESYTEENVRSSREGLTELLSVNVTLIRRRLKRPDMSVEYCRVGGTKVALLYVRGRAANGLVESIKRRLGNIPLDAALESGFIEPFLRERTFSLFSGIGHTERPDVLCAKIMEGRVGIIVDGTPFALTAPQLFIENFQSFDDYSQKAVYATLIRAIKFFSFLTAMLLPGAYVAVALHSLEMLPVNMLSNLIAAERSLSLPIMFEALFIQAVYEIVREAGLRLPRPVGHAVSLIGALVVGDTAIQAGLVGAPMVMIAAFTAVCSFTIPKLYQITAILRFGFILVAGLFGPLGLALGICFVFLNICAVDSFGTPYTSPISPYGGEIFTDGLVRRNWRKLADSNFTVTRLPGSKRSGR